MKVSNAIASLSQYNPDSQVAITWITENDIVDVGKEQGLELQKEDVVKIIESIEEGNDNWDDLVQEAIHDYVYNDKDEE